MYLTFFCIAHYYPTMEDRIHDYTGNYHLVGKVLEGELCTTSNWKDTNTVEIKNFKLGFSKELDFVLDGVHGPVLQLEFVAKIPWVLEEQPDEM